MVGFICHGIVCFLMPMFLVWLTLSVCSLSCAEHQGYIHMRQYTLQIRSSSLLSSPKAPERAKTTLPGSFKKNPTIFLLGLVRHL